VNTESNNILKENRTFGYLEDLHFDPTMEFVHLNAAKLNEYVEKPVQSLFSEVSSNLPLSITSQIETVHDVFPTKPFHKNKWGVGNKAWDFFWGAFYPKAGGRTTHAQLFLWINYEQLEIGFAIGEYGTQQKQRFKKNFISNQPVLARMLRDENSDIRVYTKCDDDCVGPVNIKESRFCSWDSWLRDSNHTDIYASVSLHRDIVLQNDQEDIIDGIVKVYQNLFPLVLLTVLDDPMPAIGEYLYPSKRKLHRCPKYTLSQCSADLSVDETLLNRWVRAIERKGQAIFYGPPGTGKTYLAKKLATHLISGENGFMEIIQFHPAYAYEDFIQGIRPTTSTDGQISYPLVHGRFLEFCKKAESRDGKCVLIIDEINRANLARVFGELMFLMEYREEEIPLSGGGRLRIPNNMRIIGTMNTTDRSIALVDHALRRRFSFIHVYPDYNILKRYHEKTSFTVDGLIEVLQELNRQIGDKNYFLGVSFFLIENISEHIEDIWCTEIEPYIEEILFDRPDTIEEFRWEKVNNKVIYE